ncbi:MAG: hypothetical protein IPL97_04385 [Niastella sp.]|nr:hypothetical protein [Niastella sp.]
MDYETHHTEFSRSIMVGLFAGIVANVLCLAYDAFFRLSSSYFLSELINVSTLSFFVVIIGLITGVIYYYFHHYLKGGNLFFRLFSIIITGVLFLLALHANRTPNHTMNIEFRELLSGIIIISGLCFLLLIPFFYKKDFL